MHDIDRTQLEFESYAEEFESSGPYAFQRESAVFDETEEMELAAELLGVGDEAELDQFLGDLIGKAGQAIGKAVKGPVGRKLGGFLKGAVGKVLPAAAGVLGTAFGGPVGGMVANKVASAAGDMFGLELEGLSPEDQEFETARRFVRFAGEAAKRATRIGSAADAQGAARSAVVQAAKKLAPGLLKPVSDSLQSEVPAARNERAGQSGRWLRQGQKIVLIGV
jgi:hypothetical protein